MDAKIALTLGVLFSLTSLVACSSDDSSPAEPGAAGSGGSAAAGSSGASQAAGSSGQAGGGQGGGQGGNGQGGSQGGSGQGGGGGKAGEEVPKVAVSWQPCSLLADYPPTSKPATYAAECADVPVPVRWSEPGGATLTLRVKRLRATTTPARGQLWLLDGGPGSASLELEPVIQGLATRDPGLDLYTTDFRGTGDSTRLSCPQDGALAPDNLAACLATLTPFSGDLGGFTTSEAARDLASLVASTREAGQTSVVFGFSYGTFWLHRLLQIFPTLLDGAILDSIATPTADFSHYSVDADAVAQEFFGRCAADATCSSKLGPDPWAKVQQLFALPPKDFCPVGGDGSIWKPNLARLLRKTAFRPLVPALVYRLLRCSAADKKAISHLIKQLQGMTPEPDKAFSTLLYDHVVFSELWTTSPKTAAEDDAIDAGLLIAPGGTGDQQRLWEAWPRAPLDAFAGQTATTTTPLLLLQGGLDPQTPRKYVDPFAASFTAPAQHYVTFPDSPHGVAFQTPKASDPTRTCGMDLVLQFVASPTAPLDLSCQSDLLPIDLGDQPAMAQSLLGQSSLWENDAPPPPGAPSWPRPAWVPPR